MRNSLRTLTIIIYLLSAATSSFAEWQQCHPRIAGGTLTPRRDGIMVTLENGRFFLFGGYTSTGTVLADTWIFEINYNRWTRIYPTTTISARRGHGAARLDQESVLIFGGYTGGPLSETWIYNDTVNSLTRQSPTIVGGSLTSRYDIELCILDEGMVLMFGGRTGGSSSNLLNETWIYNAISNQWQMMSPTINGVGFNARIGMGLSSIGNGRVLMFGGDNNSSTFNDTWVYNLNQNQWSRMEPTIITPMGNVFSARTDAMLTYIGGDRALLFGGRNGTSTYNEVWMYDLSDNTWTYLANPASSSQPASRCGMHCNFAGVGQIVMFGGSTSGGSCFNDTWRYSIPENAKDTLVSQTVAEGIQLSWALPADFSGAQFSIDRDGVRISSSVAAGTEINGRIPYTYIDPNPTSGRIYRYRINESYPVINSLLSYPEIAVPYCP